VEREKGNILAQLSERVAENKRMSHDQEKENSR